MRRSIFVYLFIFIAFFTVRGFSIEESECLVCADGETLIDLGTTETETTISGTYYNYPATCGSSTRYADGYYYVSHSYKTTSTSNFEVDSSWFTTFTYTTIKIECQGCNSPDETYDIDTSLFKPSSIVPSMSCSDSPEQVTDKMNQCSSIGGSYMPVSKTNCCITSQCFIPIDTIECAPDEILYNNECTRCPGTNSLPISPTQCGCEEGYFPTSDGRDCVKCLPPEYFNTNSLSCQMSDCNLPLVPADDYTLTRQCINPPELPPEDDNITVPPIDSDSNSTSDGGDQDFICAYPATLFDVPFQDLMSFGDCLSFNGWTYSCPDGTTVACYYYSETNSTTPPTDDSGTETDSNTTADLDSNTTSLDLALDTLAKDETLKEVAGDLSSVLSNNAKNLNTKLDEINNNLGSRITGMNTNLANKLDTLNDSINNKSPIDLSETNGILREISDKLSPDTSDKEAELSSLLDELSEAGDNMIASYSEMFSSIQDVIGGMNAPTFSASGSCDLSTFVYGQSADFQKGFDLFVQYLRPIMLLILNLSLTYLLIVLSVRAYADVTQRVQWLFI